MQQPISAHNRRQKIDRLAREIAHFRGAIDAIGTPGTAQQKRIATLAGRCLVERERALGSVLQRPII